MYRSNFVFLTRHLDTAYERRAKLCLVNVVMQICLSEDPSVSSTSTMAVLFDEPDNDGSESDFGLIIDEQCNV